MLKSTATTQTPKFKIGSALLLLVSLLSLGSIGVVGCSSQDVDPALAAATVTATEQKASFSNQIDVLFVVDTSGAMSVHQKNLGAQMASFTDSLNQTGFDYQFAVTSMDVTNGGERGRFVSEIGAPAILTSHSPNLASSLASRLYLGDYEWQPSAHGFEATKLALSGMNSTTGPNAGFLRDNTPLMVIYLSNEDDDSVAADYEAFLNQVRPPSKSGARSWSAHYMGVLPDDPACKVGHWGNREPGTKFIAAAKVSGGAVESICSGDIAKAARNVKTRILEMISEYPPAQKPLVNGTATVGAQSLVKVDFDRDGMK